LNPLNRTRLIETLLALQECHNEPPYFAAVELSGTVPHGQPFSPSKTIQFEV